MDPFQISKSHSLQQPQNALMVVGNRQVQVWNSLNCWSPHLPNPQHRTTHMELNANSGVVLGEETPTTRSPSSSTSPSPVRQEQPKKRVFKKRKATHTIRKEQKAALEKEIEALQSKLKEIKFQALVQQGEVSKSYHDQAVENAVLRESIQDQHLVMAQMRALLSGHTLHHVSGVRPMETRICLTADRVERREVLHALRGAKLREAKRFLQARSCGINPTNPYFQEERYETADGDYCITRFEITPLHGVKGGVRAVFDAVLQAAFNVEIIISETSGDITVREDDDMDDDCVSQMRLVSQTNRGVLLENNLVHFVEYSHGESETNGKSSYAVTATDFVDEDDLYPYKPLERVRRDMTAAMIVSYLDSPRKTDTKAHEDPVILITRWSCARICHTNLNISREAMLDIRDSAIRSQGTYLNCVRQTLGLPVNSTTKPNSSKGESIRVSKTQFPSTTNSPMPTTLPQLQSDASDSRDQVKKKRVYKKRKATHTLRKEEKLALEAEITALQTKIESLKFQVLVQRGDQDTTLNKKVARNAVLRDAVQMQHLVVAQAQGMLLESVQRTSYEVRPIEMFIHLTADRRERHETLKALRGPKLYYARRFIQHRSMGMHPTAEYFHEERYETPEGDYCNVRFDRVALRGVKGGIRAVLDALKHAVFNAEIIISEKSGNLTIREDDNLTEEEFSQTRLVTQISRGILVENNLVHFTDFVGADGEDSYAVTTTDFVDVDDLYPFRPHERVRRDATSAILATSYVDTGAKTESMMNGYSGHTSSEEEGETVIVITRWTFTKICHTELNISHQTLREMRDLSGRVSETMLNCVRETVGLSN